MLVKFNILLEAALIYAKASSPEGGGYMKPEYKSYLKRQFSKHPYIVKCEKTGYIFREVNGVNHRLYFGIFIALMGGFMIYLADREIDWGFGFFLAWFLASIIYLFVLYIVHLIYTRILYKVSKFEVIDERELDKYPGVIESLKKAELRSK